MFDPPTTSEEAKRLKYGRDDGFYNPSRYDPLRCAYEVSEPPWYINRHQCHRKPGHGPNQLYCKQHAKRIQGD